MILGTIWIGFMVRSTQLNAQRLRMGWPTVSRQWGRLSGGLWMACLLLVGLGRMVGYYDQLSSLRYMREDVIQLATQAKQEGKFTPEYLSPLGITNRPSPEALVDALIRQRGFGWLLQDFNKHFQGKPSIGADPRRLMDPELARRYGLQTGPTSPVSTTPSTNAASPESASAVPQPMMMSRELMLRYGLLPKRPSRASNPTPPKASTNPPANPAPGQ
jgi:hypothetical protein